MLCAGQHICTAFVQLPLRYRNVYIHWHASAAFTWMLHQQHSRFLFQATASTHLHQMSGCCGLKRVCFVKPLHCATEPGPGKCDVKEAKGPTRWSHCEGPHWDLRQLQWLMQHFEHAEGCCSARCLGTTFCSALSGGQSSCNAVSEFSPYAHNLSLSLTALSPGKRTVCPE